MKTRLLVLAACAFFLSACSSTPDHEGVDPVKTDQVQPEHANELDFDFRDERDPFENFNRSMWNFNRNVLDRYILNPAATAYSYVPRPLRWGLYNMTENLTEPASVVNNLLQGKPKASLISIGRFVLNSTVGLLGFFDVATEMGLTQERETFGETLAVWGTPDGPYVMLPGLGPTVVIDRGGDLVDDIYSPTMFFNIYVSAIRFAIRGLEQRIELREVEPMLENSLDQYAFVRDVYFSYWQDKVYDGEPPRDGRWEEWDDWDDWDDETFAYRSWQSTDDALAWQMVKRQY